MDVNVTSPAMEGTKMLEERWRQLSLSKEEQISIIVGEEASKEENI